MSLKGPDEGEEKATVARMPFPVMVVRVRVSRGSANLNISRSLRVGEAREAAYPAAVSVEVSPAR